MPMTEESILPSGKEAFVTVFSQTLPLPGLHPQTTMCVCVPIQKNIASWMRFVAETSHFSGSKWFMEWVAWPLGGPPGKKLDPHSLSILPYSDMIPSFVRQPLSLCFPWFPFPLSMLLWKCSPSGPNSCEKESNLQPYQATILFLYFARNPRSHSPSLCLHL